LEEQQLHDNVFVLNECEVWSLTVKKIVVNVSKAAERIFRPEKDEVTKQFRNDMKRKSFEYFRNVKCENVVDKTETTRNTFSTLAAKLGK
jgi:hypothetical protein